MPCYQFYCVDCNKFEELNIKITEIKLSDEIKLDCNICKNAMIRDYESEFSTHSIAIERDKLKPMEIGTHSTKDVKKKQAAATQVAIADEGFESVSEMKEARDIAKEEEKKRNLVAGTILGGRVTPKTKEEKETIRQRDLKKKNEQRRKRGMHT